MPVRVNVAFQLTNKILKSKKWAWGNREWAEAWDEAELVADAIYVDVIDTIDWQRIMIESCTIHLEKPEEHQERFEFRDRDGYVVCGWCIREALLNTDRKILEGKAVIPDVTVNDWAAEVARLVGKREQ